MALYDEIRDRFKGNTKSKPKEKMAEEEKKAPKKKKKMNKSAALFGGAALPSKSLDLLMPLGVQNAAFGFVGDKLRKKLK